MAPADAPLRTSMLSMSAGLRSEMRFGAWSWLEGIAPRVPAFEIPFRPVEISELLRRTPSTTYRGLEFALIDVTPRSWIWAPPPGAPEFVEMTAPAILPCSAFSTVGEGARESCSAETWAIELAELA